MGESAIPALRVVHVLRAPVGGLFRHVRDLVPAQADLGLAVGMVCDSTAADRLTAERLAALEPYLSLGLHMMPMSREIGPSDVRAYAAVRNIAARTGADILHGHGAKGGAFARLAAAALARQGGGAAAFYTPHGGSLNFPPSTLKGRLYMALERRLAGMTAGIVFESAWSERVYRRQVGNPSSAVRVIPNGLLPADFSEHRPGHDAADVLFVGELRFAKGVDVLLEALSRVRAARPVTAMIVGDGPDGEAMRRMASRLGLDGAVRFPGAMPAARAFGLGRVLAIPSRWESFPYIVLEAAAGAVPLITTAVGGIPEIVGDADTPLIPPGDVDALARALDDAFADPAAAIARAHRLQQRVASRFTVERMSRDIVEFYCAASRGVAPASDRAIASTAR